MVQVHGFEQRALVLVRSDKGPNDKAIVWDLENKTKVNQLDEHPGRLKSVFFGTGGVVLTLGEDHRLRAWDPNKTLMCLATFTADFDIVAFNHRSMAQFKSTIPIVFDIGRATTLTVPALAKERAKMQGVSIFGALGNPNLKELSAARKNLKTATPPATPVKKWKPEPLPAVKLKPTKSRSVDETDSAVTSPVDTTAPEPESEVTLAPVPKRTSNTSVQAATKRGSKSSLAAGSVNAAAGDAQPGISEEDEDEAGQAEPAKAKRASSAAVIDVPVTEQPGADSNAAAPAKPQQDGACCTPINCCPP